MEKRWLVFFSAFIVVGGILFAPPGDGQTVLAATPSPQTATGILLPLARPPAKMCVGEEAMVTAGALSLVPAKAAHITAAASGGTLTNMNWRLTNGWVGAKMLRTTFTATEAGKSGITFVMEESGTKPVVYPVEIVDCRYDLSISGTETSYTDEASFQYTIEGDAVINGSKENDRLSGNGTYTVTFLINYKKDAQGVTCISASPSVGTDSFTVTGSRSGTVLNISLEFKPVTLSGASFRCEDENGRETIKDKLPPVFEGKSDTQKYLLLTGLTVTPWNGVKFNFSKSGRGFLTVIPRSLS